MTNKRPIPVQWPDNPGQLRTTLLPPGRQTPTIPTVYGRQSVTSLSLPVSRRRSRSCRPCLRTSHLLAAGKHKTTSNISFVTNSFVITFGYDIPSGGVTPPLENPPKEEPAMHKTIFSPVDPRKRSSRCPKKLPSTGKIRGGDHG